MNGKKKLYDGRFVPARKAPPPTVTQLAATAELAAATKLLAEAVRPDVLAMDLLATKGEMAFRDGNGKIWVVTVQASDVPELKGEYDLRMQQEADERAAEES